MPFPPLYHAPDQGLDPTLRVNDVLLRWPAAARVLNAFGIDTCCGGGASLRDAADHAGVPLEPLLDAIAMGARDVPPRSGSR